MVLASARSLMLVNSCVKFQDDAVNGKSGHDFVLETATYKVQRGITQKV